MKRLKIISIFFSVIVILVFLYFGGQDRLGLKKNSININIINKASLKEQKVKLMLIFGYDTLSTTTYYNNSISTIDWYGEDYIELNYGNIKNKIKFKEFKKRSWEKYTCNINIDYRKENILVEWEIYTSWNSNKGTYVYSKL